MSRTSPIENPPSALLTDVWYTLVYYRQAERDRIETLRQGTWFRALTEAGLSTGRARSTIARIRRESRATERRGRTPALEDRIREVGRATGLRLDVSGLVDRFDAIVEKHQPRVAPGARATLRAVRARGIRVGIVSNVVFESADGARRLLRRLGLHQLSDAIVLSADDGIAKPDPRPFCRCLRELAVEPAGAWYLGDMPTDITGASAAGVHPVRFVGLARFGPPFSPDAPLPRSVPVLRRWPDLLPMVSSRGHGTGPQGTTRTPPGVR
jgi:FMN phosphatase YigB (HAD superfamily)